MFKQRVDEFQRSNRFVGLVVGIVKKGGDDRAGNLAALMTYYGFFSLFPLLMVAFTIMGFVLAGNEELRADISRTMSQRFPLPGVSADTITGSGLALGIGIALTLWSGLSATQVAQDALNTIWDVPRAHQPKFLVKRLRGLAVLAVVGVGLVAATLASSLSTFLGPAAGIGGVVVSAVVNALVIAALFRLMVERTLTWSEIWPGALFGGVGWTVLQSIGGWYTKRLVDNADKTYGTFAVVIGLLSWIFLQSEVFVYAAELSSVWSRKLFPRALDTTNPTEADRRVHEAIAARSVPAVMEPPAELAGAENQGAEN